MHFFYSNVYSPCLNLKHVSDTPKWPYLKGLNRSFKFTVNDDDDDDDDDINN